uniref:BTB domain-containing protein n=1 Tax=Caenorhabditis japonica TaxID=281687 RepID=A0A8R1HH86_CAEJA
MSLSVRKTTGDGEPTVSVYLDCRPVDDYLLDKEWSVIADVRVRILIRKNVETKEDKDVIFSCDKHWLYTFVLPVAEIAKLDVLAFHVVVGITKITNLYSAKFINFSHERPGETDLILKVDGNNFYVSKQLLCIQSPVFHAMFSGSFVECQMPEVVIRGVDFNSFHCFLQYIHMAPIRICHENICHLIELADRFLVKRLMVECEDFLIRDDAKHEKEIVELSSFYYRERVPYYRMLELMLSGKITTKSGFEAALPCEGTFEYDVCKVLNYWDEKPIKST